MKTLFFTLSLMILIYNSYANDSVSSCINSLSAENKDDPTIVKKVCTPEKSEAYVEATKLGFSLSEMTENYPTIGADKLSKQVKCLLKHPKLTKQTLGGDFEDIVHNSICSDERIKAIRLGDDLGMDSAKLFKDTMMIPAKTLSTALWLLHNTKEKATVDDVVTASQILKNYEKDSTNECQSSLAQTKSLLEELATGNSNLSRKSIKQIHDVVNAVNKQETSVNQE